MPSSKITIYVAYHKTDDILIKNDVFQPIHVGKDFADFQIEGAIADNIGDNISSKNNLYCELTAIYWAWKNDNTSDYIGLCHYRRVFSMDKPKSLQYLKEKIRYHRTKFTIPFRDPGGSCVDWNAHIISDNNKFIKIAAKFAVDIKKDVEKGKHTIYALKPVRHNGIKFEFLFKSIFGAALMDLLQEIVADKYPELSPAFLESLKSNESYYANMTIMRRDEFEKYAAIMFDLLNTHQTLAVERGILIDPMREKVFARGEAFLSEFFTSVYIRYKLKTQKSSVKLLNAVLNKVL